jgi:hypothetical protein
MKIAMAMALLLSSSISLAAVSSRSLTCQQAKSLVERNGAVTFITGSHSYGRYVAHSAYCDWYQYAEAASVPTRDTPACMVGFICVTRPNGGS